MVLIRELKILGAISFYGGRTLLTLIIVWLRGRVACVLSCAVSGRVWLNDNDVSIALSWPTCVLDSHCIHWTYLHTFVTISEQRFTNGGWNCQHISLSYLVNCHMVQIQKLEVYKLAEELYKAMLLAYFFESKIWLWCCISSSVRSTQNLVEKSYKCMLYCINI